MGHMKSILYLFIFLALPIHAKMNCQETSEILIQLNHSPHYKYNSQQLTKWFPSKQKLEKGRVLVLHGLNDNPETMNDITTHLNLQGYTVLRGALTGHRGSLLEMKSLKMDDWKRDLKLLVCLMNNKNKIQALPIHAIGFSMGALLIMDYLSTNPSDLYFQSLNFLSPAFAIHWYLKLLTPLRFFPSKWLIPSRNLAEYRSQDGTSIAAYQAFFKTLKNFKPNSLSRLNSSLKVFMDPRDELVSFKSLMGFLPKGTMIPINTDHHEHQKLYRHITFSKKSLGKKEWNSLMDNMLKNLTQGL